MKKYLIVFKNTEEVLKITKEEQDVLIAELKHLTFLRGTNEKNQVNVVSLSENTIVNLAEILFTRESI